MTVGYPTTRVRVLEIYFSRSQKPGFGGFGTMPLGISSNFLDSKQGIAEYRYGNSVAQKSQICNHVANCVAYGGLNGEEKQQRFGSRSVQGGSSCLRIPRP